MYVYVCFDVEDLVHPDSDDITRDLGEMLADVGIVASMYVVGEKARLWERRGRTDVITAVGQHDVGLHTDHHSMHPTVSEYLADKGWLDGVAEAMRQEEPGARDLARLFGMYPSTWATSGSSWAPHIAAATRQMGIPSHMYSMARSGETGACWFAGQLCYFDYAGLPSLEDAYSDDASFETELTKLLQYMGDAQRRGVSCMGLFTGHPTRLRYTLFWDDVNFARGQNPAPADYRFAPRRTDEEYTTSLRNVRRLILAVRDLPGMEIITVRALNGRFAPGTGSIAWPDVRPLALATAESETIRAEEPLASPAQALDVLAQAVLRLANGGAAPAYLPLRRVLGPVDQPPTLDAPLTISAEAGLALCRELVNRIDQTGHLPTSLAVNGISVGPGPLLKAAAIATLDLERGLTPGRVTLRPGAEEPAIAARLAEYVCQQLPGWEPHSPGLRVDQLALHARLQSWSLRPAVLAG